MLKILSACDTRIFAAIRGRGMLGKEQYGAYSVHRIVIFICLTCEKGRRTIIFLIHNNSFIMMFMTSNYDISKFCVGTAALQPVGQISPQKLF